MRVLIEVWIILTVSILSGLIYNNLSGQKIPLLYSKKFFRFSDIHNPRYDEIRKIEGEDSVFIGIDVAKVLYEKGWAIFIDARKEEEFYSGHIPGSLNIPEEQFTFHIEKLLKIPVDTPVVIYCSSSECGASLKLAQKIKPLGYKYIFIFEEGWDEWSKKFKN